MEDKKPQMAWCPVCGGFDFANIMKGYEDNPKHFLKCTRCGREFEEPKACDDESCKI